jgi:hypothetical protein
MNDEMKRVLSAYGLCMVSYIFFMALFVVCKTF